MVGFDPIEQLARWEYGQISLGTTPLRGAVRSLSHLQFFFFMQESHTPVSTSSDSCSALLHEEIAQCAHDLWIKYGRPTDRDLAIWLEAEQHLHSTELETPDQNCIPATSVGPALTESARASACTTIKASASATPASSQAKAKRTDSSTRANPSAPFLKR